MQSKNLYGIIGGMGPAASAEFTHYIYSQAANQCTSERDYPRMILISDPLAPDRAISHKQYQFSDLTAYLKNSLQNLSHFKVDKVIICCVVAHACIPQLPAEYQDKIVNMMDLLKITIRKKSAKVLMLATPMFYELQLLSDKDIIFPDSNDTKMLHEYIYKFKISENKQDILAFINQVELFLQKYQANTIALACSDLHRINRFIQKNNITVSFSIIDALELTATYILHDGQGVTS